MLRWANPADKAAIMKLWAVDFESYEPYYRWYFDTVYRPELTLCDFVGTALAASLQLAPYTLNLRGMGLPVCYVVGVITDPAFRKQGRGQALLQSAHDYLRQQGYAASLLYTDIPGFYEPWGYRHCYGQQTLQLPVAARQIAEVPLWQEAQPLDEIAALADIYGRMVTSYDGYIRREPFNWRVYLGEQLCDKASLLLWPEHAYVLYTLNKEYLHIIELGFRDNKTLQAALAAAAQVADAANVPQLLWYAPDNAPQMLPHIPAKYWSPRPFAMARLHDWPLVLDTIAYPRQLRTQIQLNIQEYGQQESRLLVVEDGQAQVQTACSAAVPQVNLDIGELTRLVFGVPGAVQDSPLQSQLTEIFPPRPLWVNEYT